jgi:hypothetical protein
MTSKKTTDNLKDLFSNQGAGLGLDDESSSVLIANLDATTTPMCLGSPFDEDEQECDDFRLIEFVFDKSGSMDEVEDEVRNGVNNIIMPGLLGGAADQVGAIRYHGLAFDNRVDELWSGGWKKLTENVPSLTTADYSAGGATALNKGVLDGVTALTSQALQIEELTGTYPECVLVVLSDGANNQAPRDSAEVKKVLDKLSGELFTLVFIGFETWERVDFKQIAADLSFRDVKDFKNAPGETDEDLKRRMRNAMKVFSQKLVGRVSSSQVGTSSGTTTGSTGFWD